MNIWLKLFMFNFKITNSILSKIEKISSIWWVIENAKIILEWEQKLRKIARLRSGVFSTRIEWSKITLDQAEDFVDWKKIIARPRDKQELENYLKVLDYIETRESEEKIEKKDIFKIHKLTTNKILSSWLQNKYREQQNAIYDSKGWIIYLPPEYNDVESLMNKLLDFVNNNKDISVLIRAWILHHFFVIIHPFIDWNWRTSRALTQLFLYQNWFNTKKYFSLEEYYDSDLNNYYKNINIWTDFYNSLEKWIDSTQFLEYFLEWIEIELSNLKKQIEEIKEDEFLETSFEKLWLTKRQLHILIFIRKKEKVQMKDFLEKFDLWRTTIKRKLSILLEKKLVKKSWIWKSIFYNL